MGRFRLRFSIHEFDLPIGETMIGRSEDCRLTLEDPSVSREHARVTVTSDKLTLCDLGSRNGTKVNGIRLSKDQPVELHDGDYVLLGAVQLTVSLLPEGTLRRRATGRYRRCPRCGAPGVAEAPTCPSCGEAVAPADTPELDGLTPVVSNEKQAWWLELQCDLLERAVSLERLAEADAVMQRIMSAVDAQVEAKEHVAIPTVERALTLSLKLCAVRGEGRAIAWVFGILRKMHRGPEGPLLAQLLQTPIILLREVREPLRELLNWMDAEGMPSSTLDSIALPESAPPKPS